MEEIKLARQNLGQVFKFRHGEAFAQWTSFIIEKLPKGSYRQAIWVRHYPWAIQFQLKWADLFKLSSPVATTSKGCFLACVNTTFL